MRQQYSPLCSIMLRWNNNVLPLLVAGIEFHIMSQIWSLQVAPVFKNKAGQISHQEG